MKVIFGKLDVTANSFVNIDKLVGAGLLLSSGELVFRGPANGGEVGLWQISRGGVISWPDHFGPVIAIDHIRWLFEPLDVPLSRRGELSPGQIVFEGPDIGWGLMLTVSDHHIAYWNFANSTARRADSLSFRVFDKWRLTAVSEDNFERELVTITSD